MQKEIRWLLKEKYPEKFANAHLGEGQLPKQIIKDIQRIKKGEPLDYVIGFTEFLGCKIDLSKKPLIPRPETEFWVEKAITAVKGGDEKKKRCLDLFSGSGCIGVSILKNSQVLLCDMADSQLKCLEQAKINCRINNIDKKRYRIIKSDVFKNIKRKPALSGVEGYDFIFANPPYVPKNRKNKIQKSVLKFEPKQALFAKDEGLFYINKFLKQAKNYLNDGGIIFMEFSPEQKKGIERLLKEYKYSKWEFCRDQYNRYRWLSIS